MPSNTRRSRNDSEQAAGVSGVKIGLAAGIPVAVVGIVLVIVLIINSQSTPAVNTPPPKPTTEAPIIQIDDKDKKEKPKPKLKEPTREAKDKQESLYKEAQQAFADMKFNKAIGLCVDGIDEAPRVWDKSSRWYKLRALCHLAIDKHSHAAADYDMVIKIDGASADLHVQCARARLGALLFKEALYDLDKAITLGGEKKALTAMVIEVAKVTQAGAFENKALSMEAYTLAIKHNPKDPELLLLRAAARTRDSSPGAFAAAQADFRAAVALDPKVMQTAKGLADALKIVDD